MAHAFMGGARNKVDGKGRMSIPPAFRRALEAGDPDWAQGLQPQMIVVYGPTRQKFLEAYSIAEHEVIRRMIADMPLGSRERDALETFYLGLIDTVSVDETGRFVLPQKARAKLRIEDEVQLVGKGNHFRIWHPDDFDAEELAMAEATIDGLDTGAPPPAHPLTLLYRNRQAAGG